MKPLSAVRESGARSLELRLDIHELKPKKLKELQGILEQNAGTLDAVLKVTIDEQTQADVVLPPSLKVRGSDDLVAATEELFGRRVLHFR